MLFLAFSKTRHFSLRSLLPHRGQCLTKIGKTGQQKILHFNDVYNVESRDVEPVGGASRFVHAMKSFLPLNPLVLFSGDIFSPSLLSTFTKGEHMSHILNEVGTQCAVFGNHDFDFGLEVLEDRVSETNFPWLMSNAIYNETGQPLGDGKITHVIEWNGKRIGMMGLVEEEWIETTAMINADEITFTDFVQVAQKLSAELKEQGCDYVIALTHMRTKNDRKLAESDTQVDLILGGHDHDYDVIQVNNRYIIKSGTDFRQFSKITIDFQNECSITVEEINVTKCIPEDEAVNQIIKKYEGTIMCTMGEVLGIIREPLEGRFAKIRTEETNLGNWACDVLLSVTGGDVAVLNSGTFRSDQIHPPGNFTLGDLMRIIPKFAPTALIKAKGETLLKALENGVSKYPVLEGRFPQVGGISFAFDPSAPPGERIDPLLVRIQGEYLDLEKYYKLALKNFLYFGNDGYTMLQDCERLIDLELGPELSTSIQNFCYSTKNQYKSKSLSKHDEFIISTNQDQNHLEDEIDALEQHSYLRIPSVEGRIIKLTPEIKEKLYREREKLLSGCRLSSRN